MKNYETARAEFEKAKAEAEALAEARKYIVDFDNAMREKFATKNKGERIVMKDYSGVDFITHFCGELANDYDTHKEYVEYGGWEKDYFIYWTECEMNDGNGYPSLEEIIRFATRLESEIEFWLEGVEAGVIDPEAGVEE